MTTTTAPISLNEITFNNGQYHTKALGLAVAKAGYKRSDALVLYISFAGSNTACESTRASLHRRKGKLPGSRWSYTEYPVAPSMKVAKRKLPNSNELHYIMWDATAPMILIRDDRALPIRERKTSYDDYDAYRRNEAALQALKDEHQQAIRERFVELINTRTKTPMLPEWADIVMEETEGNNKGWFELNVYGDVVFGAIINPQFDWLNRIRQLLIDKIITIPPLSPELAKLKTLSATRQAAENKEDAHPLEISIAPNSNFLFEPGRISITAGFQERTTQDFPEFDYETYLWRHLTGDWREPEMDPEDIAANQRAAAATGDDRTRVFSAFQYPHPQTNPEKFIKFWVITEWDRSATTFLLPEEY